ncbi:MAG: hypothetical protein HUU55_01060 [Myxococcales bacterium]|nr:hypothetical protein [Myxococcales bacterium]
MWWFRNSTERRFLRLLDRYLDPGRSWSGALDRRLRRDMAESADLRVLYDRAIVAHRLMLGLPGDTASALENTRMHTVIVNSAVAPAAESGFLFGRWLAACGAMGAVAVLAIALVPVEDPKIQVVANDDGYIGVRSGTNPLSKATRVGVVGVTESGLEYEVEANGFIYLNDYARLNYRSSVAELDHLFVFGLQHAANPLWYYPLPEEQKSRNIVAGPDAIGFDLPDETLLSRRHVVGDWYIVGIFSNEPISWEHVQRGLAASRDVLEAKANADTPDKIAVAVRECLELGADDQIEVVSVKIQPGSYDQRKSD